MSARTADDPFRDSSGRTLAEYPRPSVAVDTAMLTVADGGLAVVLAASAEGFRLPGTFLHDGEVLADAVRRSLRDKLGIEGLRPEQLRVFDALDRDDRGWVLSAAHLAVVSVERLGGRDDIELRPVAEATGLLFDHDDIVRIAVERVRRRYEEHPDPDELMPEEFTLRELQLLHEAVAGESVMRDSFRRGMEGKLQLTGRMSAGRVGKPARVWRRLER